MKKIFLAFVLTGLINDTEAQIEITADVGNGNQTMVVNNGQEIQVQASVTELKTFGLKFASLASGHKLIVKVSGIDVVDGTSSDYLLTDIAGPKIFTFKSNIINSQITILNHDLSTGTEAALMSFKFL